MSGYSPKGDRLKVQKRGAAKEWNFLLVKSSLTLFFDLKDPFFELLNDVAID